MGMLLFNYHIMKLLNKEENVNYDTIIQKIYLETFIRKIMWL